MEQKEREALQKKYSLSADDVSAYERYREYLKEVPDREQEDRQKLFERAINAEEEAQVHLAEIYMKKAPETALEYASRGVSLQKLIEYALVGAVLGVEGLASAEQAHETIERTMRQYIERCW